MVSHGGGREFKGTDFLYLKCKGLKFSITVVVKIKNCRVLVEPPAEERWSGLLGRWLLGAVVPWCSSARLLLGAVVVVRVKSRPEVTAPQLQLHRAAVQLGEPLALCSATAACMIVGSFTARRASTVRHQHIEHNSEP